MSSVVISGDTSGAITLSAPAVAGTNTLTLPASTGTVALTSQLPVAGSGPAFGVYLSSAQNISTGTFTKINFDTEEFDTANCFTSGKFTPTVAGYYQLNATMYFNSSASCQRGLLMLYKNNAVIKDGNYMPPIVSDNIRGICVLSTLVYANGSTDYFEVYGYIQATSPYFDGGQNQVYFNGFLARSA
jgi:hypothetical protein